MTIKDKYKSLFKNKKFIYSLFVSFSILLASLIINFYAGNYATEKGSNAVTDIVLSNVPIFNLDDTIIYSTLAFWSFIILLCLSKPGKIPFVADSAALFILIRSVFISLTHIGPFPTAIILDSNILNKFTFAGDLFFSGHTGFPFLMALIFWNNKKLRYIFIALSIFFGIIMLLSHLHYSIDVLAAFFITYTIYQLAETLFKKDKAFFD